MLIALAERPTSPAFPAWLDALPDPLPDVDTGWPLLTTPVPTGFPAPVDDAIERHLSLDTPDPQSGKHVFDARPG